MTLRPKVVPALARVRRWLQRQGLLEAAVLASLLILAGSLWVFVEVADEVREGDARRADEFVLRTLRSGDDPAWPIGPRWIVNVARDLTALVSTALKTAFERARPDLVPHLAEVSSLSFPSGHSMLSAVTYLTLGALLARTTADRRIKTYFLANAAVLVLIVGLTRIYLGVHFPTDVLAGWCAGIVWALLCSLIARWLQRKGAVEKETPAAETR